MEGRKISVCFKEDEAFWMEWIQLSLFWEEILNFSETLNFFEELLKKLLKILTVSAFNT